MRKRGGSEGTKGAARSKANGQSPSRPRARLPLHLLFLKHTQGIVTAATTIGVLHYRNFHSLFFVVGSLSTSFSGESLSNTLAAKHAPERRFSATAKGLKLVIKEPRPPGSIVTKTHGMPSTHSSTITFMSLYLVGLLVAPMSPVSDLLAYRSLLVPLLLASPPLIMWSRVKLGLHTPEQCMVGGALGIFNALFLSMLWRGLGSWAGLRGDLAPGIDQTMQQLEDTIRSRIGL